MAITTFIPELWSARLLYALDNAHIAANLVNRDYEGLIRQQGDTVHINTIGPVTVDEYTRNTDIDDPEVLTTTEQTLVIDQAKYFNFQVDDVDAAQSNGDLMDAAMARAAYALNDASDAYLLSVIASGADSGNVIGSSAAVSLTASNVYENIVALRTKLDKANVPTSGRFVVVPPEVYALLLLDDRFVKATDAGTANATLLNGEVGRVAGFTVYMSNNTPYATETWSIPAGVAAATTYAEQIVSTEAYRLEKRFADAVKGLHVYGAKVTDGKQLAVLKAKVANPYLSARLSGLTIGALTLDPTFDGGVTEYTATTTNATNTITATAEDEAAEISILNGETPVMNGSTATWSDGANTVKITVKNGATQEVYTVTVTKNGA